MTVFKNAIVKAPAPNFAEGLTTVDLGTPDYQRALAQHAAYCAALEECGLSLLRLNADARYPDSTFVEDVAVLVDGCAIVTRPGADSRSGEVSAVKDVLGRWFSVVACIEPPGTVDGGDICEAGGHVFIGLSHRTNQAGAQQLAAHLARAGYTSSTVDIRDTSGILHLKSGIAYLGDNRLALIEPLADRAEFGDFDCVVVPPAEEYAANCVRVNHRVLVAAGHPRFEAILRRLDYDPLLLEMSEFRKMDGGLSCLSLRF